MAQTYMLCPMAIVLKSPLGGRGKVEVPTHPTLKIG